MRCKRDKSALGCLTSAENCSTRCPVMRTLGPKKHCEPATVGIAHSF
ncbi:hypothetical protein AWB82_05843 [Caballeronia glebae]|uniref:Uncharacterized protein n=1 Tax=Caballeronia glebae TaxID=1777143 RepID=A0A158CUI0_9BURK|nr:hypothetical protein AWB82_05843 [Caballeronia glebae]